MNQTMFLTGVPTPSIEIPVARIVRVRSRVGSRVWGQQLCGTLVVATIMFSPLARGGNHPLAWLFWTVVFGAFATLLATRSSLGMAMLTPTTRRILKLGMAFVGFAIFQALPLPGLRGGVLLDLPSQNIILSYLSIAPMVTVLAAVRILGYLLFFALVLFSAQDTCRAKTIGKLMFYSIAAHGLFAIISLKFLGDGGLTGSKIAFLGAATGAFINKNSFATFLGMGLVLGLSLTLSELARRGPGRHLEIGTGLAALTVIVAALVLTQSRMGIAASALAAALVMVGSIARKSTKRGVLAAVCLVMIGLAPVLFQNGFFDLRVSAQTRFELYQQMLGMIVNRPLTGFGLDGFALAYQPFHAPPVTAEFVWDKGHSSYLTLWVETGVVFGCLPPLMGIVAVFGLLQRFRMRRRGASLALAGMAALVLAGVHSLVDFSLEIQANVLLLIAIVGLGLGYRPETKDKKYG